MTAIYECEQCNGTGYLPGGQRCPCHDEDDRKKNRPAGFGIVPPRCPYKSPYRADIAEPPSFMLKLPIDRGYPVPWFVDWIHDQPEFRAMDPRKFAAAINNRLCWVCGKQLFREEVFVIGPMCAVNRISAEPPSHRECALYSVKNCPFLTKPHMTRRTDEVFRGALKRSAGIMVERNPGVMLLWYTRRHELLPVYNRPGAGDGILFKIGSPFRLEWYRQGRKATRAEILHGFESGLPLLREAAQKDGPAALLVVEHEIQEARRLIPRD